MADVHSAHPRPPASIQVVTNTDLLYAIFSFMPLASNGRDSYMARCVYVSHAFYEPAIRVLWRNLDSLLPLWHLLAPSNTPFPDYEASSFRNDDRLLNYLEAVNSAELHRDPARWCRFVFHANYVRGITHRPSTAPAVNDTIRLLIHAVIAQNGGTTILPLLRTIMWLYPVDDTLTPFFTSRLRRATFTFKRAAEAESVSSLRKLRNVSPFLEKIELHSRFGHEGAVGLSLIQELADFAQLQDVQISQCSGPGVIRLLTIKQNLRCLKIRQIIGPWVGPPEEAISVRGLHELTVNGDEQMLSHFFGLVRFSALKTANVRLNASIETRLTTTAITNFLALFYNAVSASDLENFSFAPCSPSVGFSDNAVPPFRELIAPILPLRDLRSFIFVNTPARLGISMDDVDLEALACAWPKLKHLSLDRGFAARSSVSINGIHILYTHCAHLHTLSIPHLRWPVIGVDAIPAPVTRSPSLSHPLRRLSLPIRIALTSDPPLFGPDLSDDGAEAMARYLLDLFPRLDLDQCRRELKNSGPGPGLLPEAMHFDARWRRVLDRICSLCRARDGL